MKKALVIGGLLIVLIILSGLILILISPEIKFKITGRINADLCKYYYPLENDFNKCVYGLAGRKKEAKLCEQLNISATSDDKESCYSYAYASLGQKGLCYSLPNQKGGCIYTIAVNNRDKNLCDEAALYYPANSSEFFKNTCKKEIECRESSNNNQAAFIDCFNRK